MQMTPTERSSDVSIFEIRRDFVDGTYDIVRLSGETIADAIALAEQTSDVTSTTLLCIVDPRPVMPLVVIA